MKKLWWAGLCHPPREEGKKSLGQSFPAQATGRARACAPLDSPGSFLGTSLRPFLSLETSCFESRQGGRPCPPEEHAYREPPYPSSSIFFKRTGFQPFPSVETSCFERRQGGRPVRLKNMGLRWSNLTRKKRLLTWPASGHGTRFLCRARIAILKIC